MLAYTLERLLTQKAVIERNEAAGDNFGADGRSNWQEHLTVSCRLWWDKFGARSPSRTYVDPARTVPISEGGILVPLGTDVTEKDRIARILDGNGDPYIEGNFTITAVMNEEDHMELAIERAHLGA